MKDLEAKKTGNTRTGLNGDSTLMDMSKVYAGNWSVWLKNVVKFSGYSADTKLSDIDTSKLAQAVAKAE